MPKSLWLGWSWRNFHLSLCFASDMLRVLSKEEELHSRQKGFVKLKPGSLFDLGQERFFIAVKKISETVWEVVELTETNKRRIILGHPCEHARLHFDEMSCLNLHD